MSRAAGTKVAAPSTYAISFHYRTQNAKQSAENNQEEVDRRNL